MLDAVEPTQDPGWVFKYEGYNVLSESALESRFAFDNGFLGMRAVARSVEARPGCPGWDIAGGHRGPVATWPACSMSPTPSHRCPHWYASRSSSREAVKAFEVV